MGLLMIRCPIAGKAISTGKSVDVGTFHRMPVFFSRTYCKLCSTTHEWFAKDAWVCDPTYSECENARAHVPA